MDAEQARHAAAVEVNEATCFRLVAEVKTYVDAVSAEAARHALTVAELSKAALLLDLGTEAGAGIAAAADEETESETEAPKKRRRKFDPASLIGKTIKYNENDLEIINYVPENQSPVNQALYDFKNTATGKNSRMSAAVLIAEFKKL